MTRKKISIHTFLSSLPLFQVLGGAELTRVAAGVSEVDAPRGTVLFRPGDPCTGFHVVLFGQIKLALRTSDDGEKVIDVVAAGHSFGEAVMFLGKPYVVEAKALADSKLLFVSREAVLAGIEADPQFALKLLAGLSARLHHLMSDLETCTLRSGTKRVARYLLRELPRDGTNSIVLDTKKGIIASRLNLTQAHFSRILHDLAHGGLIEVHGREVVIRDVDRLRAHAP